MERDQNIAMGAAFTTLDRLLERSDAFSFYVCEECGNIAIFNDVSKSAKCKICIDSQCHKINTSYATKLLCQNLKALNVNLRLLTE